MIITAIKDGLGNQMFQYAAGTGFAIKYNTELFLDTSSYEKQNKTTAPRKFLLDKFNIRSSFVDEKRKAILKSTQTLRGRILNKIKSKIFQKDQSLQAGKIFEINGDIYLDGYFQSDKWFKDRDTENRLREEFCLKYPLSPESKNVETKIKKAATSISLHVRRKDYVENLKVNKNNGTCNREYYDKAVRIIGKRSGNETEVFVFSDDILWAKENMMFPFPMHFVSNSAIPDYEEIYLMSLCSHHIIANSTFSWWGAWLNPKIDKIVIAPKQWFISRKANNNYDIALDSWIKV